ncbi:hypothetical protein BDR06DRAFT_1018502 [Suillus hirtellus]|nr:hypothetical protein BDR06DRAFT_1018502 [Suillus hirtellus]
MPTVSTSQILTFNGALGPTSVATLAVSLLVNSRLYARGHSRTSSTTGSAMTT